MRQVLKFSTYPPPETRDGIGFLQGSKGGKRAELVSRNEILTVRDRESIKIEGAVGFFSLKNCDAILGRTLGVAQRRQDPGSAIFPLFLAPIPSPSPYFPRPFLLLSSSPCSSSPLNFSLRLFFPRIMSAQMFALPPARCTSRGWDSKFVSESSFSSTRFPCAGKETGNRKGGGSLGSRDLTNSPRTPLPLPTFFNC